MSQTTRFIIVTLFWLEFFGAILCALLAFGFEGGWSAFGRSFLVFTGIVMGLYVFIEIMAFTYRWVMKGEKK